MLEFKPEVRCRKYRDSKWIPADPCKKTFSTREEAGEAIKRAIKTGTPRVTQAWQNGKTVPMWFNELEVLETRVLVREVSEWKVEE